jgi:hypothetical protein
MRFIAAGNNSDRLKALVRAETIRVRPEPFRNQAIANVSGHRAWKLRLLAASGGSSADAVEGTGQNAEEPGDVEALACLPPAPCPERRKHENRGPH